MPSDIRPKNYVLKSINWYIGNFCFGIIPVIFMGLVYLMSNHKLGFDDMQKQIHEGVILFVCCAMMGGVLVDFLQSDFKWTGRQIFATFISPFAVMAILCIEYLFVVLNIINTDCFNISSFNSIFVVGFSFGYCIIFKTILLIKEDTHP